MGLGFKGERGYSAYEIAVKNGFIGDEQSWLAGLGTSSAFSEKTTTYTATSSNQTAFALPTEYNSNAMIAIYVAGLKLLASEYTIDASSNVITLAKGVETGTKVEVVITTMTTTNLPIVTSINSSSTDRTVPSAKCAYEEHLAITSAINERVKTTDIEFLTDSEIDDLF